MNNQKMGRPRLNPSDVKGVRVTVLFSKAETKRIDAFARSQKLNRSQMVRRVLLDQIEVWENEESEATEKSSTAV